jgi:hypothetical protein
MIEYTPSGPPNDSPDKLLKEQVSTYFDSEHKGFLDLLVFEEMTDRLCASKVSNVIDECNICSHPHLNHDQFYYAIRQQYMMGRMLFSQMFKKSASGTRMRVLLDFTSVFVVGVFGTKFVLTGMFSIDRYDQAIACFHMTIRRIKKDGYTVSSEIIFPKCIVDIMEDLDKYTVDGCLVKELFVDDRNYHAIMAVCLTTEYMIYLTADLKTICFKFGTEYDQMLENYYSLICKITGSGYTLIKEITASRDRIKR